MRSVRVVPAVQRGPRFGVGVVCALVTAVGVLGTGCSSSVGDRAAVAAQPSIAATRTAPVTGYDGLTGLPLSAYGTSERDDVLLFRTNEALVARCMKGRGYTGHSDRKIRTAAKTKEEKEAIHPAGAWGYIGGATARRIGFHVGVPLPVRKGPTGQELKEYKACWDKADKQVPSLAGTPGGKLTQDLFGQSFRQAATDSRVGAAREGWSACMSTAGHPADDPEKLANGPWNTQKATAREITAATAAESCTRSSELAAVYFAVLTGYQERLISAHAEVLTGYQKQIQEQIDRAGRLLAASDAP